MVKKIPRESLKGGDKVYVGGLLGRTFHGINNKFGSIDKIFLTRYPNYETHVAHVIIDGSNVPINVEHLYKIKDYEFIDHIGTVLLINPIEYIFRRDKIQNYTMIMDVDSKGIPKQRTIALGYDDQDNVKSYIISNIN